MDHPKLPSQTAPRKKITSLLAGYDLHAMVSDKIISYAKEVEKRPDLRTI